MVDALRPPEAAAPVADAWAEETVDEPEGHVMVGPWSDAEETGGTDALEAGADPAAEPVEASDDAVASDAVTEDEADVTASVMAAMTEGDAAEAEAAAEPTADAAADEAPEADTDTDTASAEAAEPATTEETAAEPEPKFTFGQPKGQVAAMWRRVSAEADLSDNEQYLACVATLLDEVQEILRANVDTAGGGKMY